MKVDKTFVVHEEKVIINNAIYVMNICIYSHISFVDLRLTSISFTYVCLTDNRSGILSFHHGCLPPCVWCC